MKNLGKKACSALAILLTGTTFAIAEYPEKPIRLIVPFGQGGASAEAARPMVKAIEDNNLLGQPIIVSYVPGAAGTVGARRVKDADPDGYSLVLWHVAANGAKVLGNVDFGPEAFVPIAGTDEKCFSIVVRETSEYMTLNALLEAAKANPETIISADNLGGANHIASVLAESAVPGAKFRHVQIGGAAKTYPALLGGHAEVNGSSISMTNKENPGLRILAYMDDERHPNHPEVPTFKELGYDIKFCNQNWWFAPIGTPQEVVDKLAEAITIASKTEYMREIYESRGISGNVIVGDELKAALKIEEAAIKAIGPRLRGEE